MNDPGSRQRIAALGECMVELREDAGGALSSAFAGDTLNTATYLRRLLPAARFDVDYLTAVGDDPLSARMISAWQSEGIGTGLVLRRAGELPGLYWIHTDASGEREFFYWRSASAARNLLEDGQDERIRESLRDGDMLFVSGISIAILSDARRETLLRLLADRADNGVRIVFDGNFRWRLWRDRADARLAYERLLASVEIFITSHVDEAALFGDRDIASTAGRLSRSGVREWVVRGGPGETVASEAGAASVDFVDPLRVVDTTGAGDAFDAAYLAARLSGLDVKSAIRAGHALARAVIGHRGAIIERAATPPLAELTGIG